VTCEKGLATHRIVDTRNACDGDLLVRESPRDTSIRRDACGDIT
jgi:hypothetical protein